MLPVIEKFLNLRVFPVELFIKLLLDLDKFCYLKLKLLVLTLQELQLAVTVISLEGDLFELIVKLFNPLLVNVDLLELSRVSPLKLTHLRRVLFFLSFDVTFVEGILLLNVCHHLSQSRSLVLHHCLLIFYLLRLVRDGPL